MHPHSATPRDSAGKFFDLRAVGTSSEVQTHLPPTTRRLRLPLFCHALDGGRPDRQDGAMRSHSDHPAMPGRRALLLVVAVIAACGPPALPPLDGTWVGRVDGTDVVVAIAVAGDEARAYLCGGDATRATWTRWLAGDASAGDVTTTADGWTVTAAVLGAGSLGGSVSGPDGVRTFTATATTGVGGLYRGSEPCPTGLVVWMTTVGPAAQGAWCKGGIYGQVEPVIPIALTPQGIGVHLVGAPAEGYDPVWLTPVTP